MEVYEVRHDSSAFKSLLFAEGVDERTHPLLRFDGTPVAGEWTPPGVWCHSPRKKRGDFWGIGSCCVPAVTHTAYPHIQTHAETGGEVLPLIFEGVELLILNVTEVVNCLNHEKCRWHKDPGGRRLNIDAGYHFRPERFSASSLFRLPETSRSTRIYCVERSGDAGEDFKAAVEKAGLKGLTFIPLWRA